MRATTAAIGFRQATAADAAVIAKLVVLAYRVEDFFIDGDRTTLPEIEALLKRDRFLVAEDAAGSLAGCVHIKLNGERGYFGMLAVHPEAQGHGLGGQLVAEAERFCAGAGCEAMDLHVVNLREELLPWYVRLGYSETGTEPFSDPWKANLPCHFITMSKPLALVPTRIEEVSP